MATKIFRIDSQWHKKEQYPFLEIENGKVFEIDNKWHKRVEYPFVEIVNNEIYMVESQWHKKEQYPFVEIEGGYSIANIVIILKQTGRL